METNKQDIIKQFKKESNMKIWFLENVVMKVKQITKPEYPDYIFYVNKNSNEIYMEYIKKDKNLFVDYHKIWLYFKSNYNNYEKIQQLIEYLMLEHYGLVNVIPLYSENYLKMRSRILNL